MADSGSTKKQTKPANSAEGNNKPDEQQLKVISALGYLGILFLVPFLMFPKEKYAVFHANQGLLLLITGVVISVVGSVIPILGWFIILPFGSIFTLVLFVMGIINAMGGKMKRLPLIGSFDLLQVSK